MDAGNTVVPIIAVGVSVLTLIAVTVVQISAQAQNPGEALKQLAKHEMLLITTAQLTV